MKKLFVLAVLLLTIGGAAASWYFVPSVSAAVNRYLFGYEPDLPPDMAEEGKVNSVDKMAFMAQRAEQVEMLRGVEKGKPFDPTRRIAAIEQMDAQRNAMRGSADSAVQETLTAAWTPIGPAPIPNGQTVPPSTPVSGRVTAIAVHPTNPDIVYVGTAQGGLYRSIDGGLNWTPLLDNALSLAIGAVTIAPSQPETVYVGTGEAGFCADCYYGVGIYRIDNASTTADLTGPLNKNDLGGDVMTGRSVSKIVVHPTDAGIIFATTGNAAGGINGGGLVNISLPARGVFRSTNATSAAPTFTKLTVAGTASPDRPFVDMVMEPGNPNNLLVSLVDSFGLNEGGVYRTTNALDAEPAFVKTFTSGTGTSASRTELAIHKDAVTGVVTVYAASGLGDGTVQRSIDGGATFVQTVDNNFCSPQCFYDQAIALDPNDATRVYLAGSPTLPFGISVDGGTSFVRSDAGLHVDSHAITVAPSMPTTIYFGSDGGIYRSINNGLTWTPLNNTQFFATQFMGLDNHPTDPNFTLGGTQDNGTNLRNELGAWRRADGGDGGYTVIDQNSPDTVNVRMYHTYFNSQGSQIRYATVGTTAQAVDGGWTQRGCRGSIPANNITCADATLFYAPLERGPGNPNTIYFGSDRLYRSTDTGATHTVVSAAPIQASVPISAIGIAPTDDNYRVVGLRNGVLQGTTTGSSTLTNFDPNNVIPNNYISRVVIDPVDKNTAYVTLTTFTVNNVFKTRDLNNPAGPTWMPITGTINNPLPRVPVSSFVIDPQFPNNLYAGTDIGVYASIDGGSNWMPFGTGLPRIAVFGLEMAPGGIVRAATHGKGMYQIPALAVATASGVTVSGKVANARGTAIARATVTITDAQSNTRQTTTDDEGFYRFEDVAAGQTYIFRIAAKGYKFQPQTVTVNEELNELNFTANKSRRE